VEDDGDEGVLVLQQGGKQHPAALKTVKIGKRTSSIKEKKHSGDKKEIDKVHLEQSKQLSVDTQHMDDIDARLKGDGGEEEVEEEENTDKENEDDSESSSSEGWGGPRKKVAADSKSSKGRGARQDKTGSKKITEQPATSSDQPSSLAVALKGNKTGASGKDKLRANSSTELISRATELLCESVEYLAPEKLWETKMSRKQITSATSKLSEMSGKLTALQVAGDVNPEHTAMAKRLMEVSDNASELFDICHELRIDPAKFIDHNLDPAVAATLSKVDRKTMTNIIVTISCDYAKKFTEDMVAKFEKVCSLSASDALNLSFLKLSDKEAALQQHGIYAIWYDKLFRSISVRAHVHAVLKSLKVSQLDPCDLPVKDDEHLYKILHGVSRLVQLEVAICKHMTMEWGTAGAAEKLTGKLLVNSVPSCSVRFQSLLRQKGSMKTFFDEMVSSTKDR